MLASAQLQTLDDVIGYSFEGTMHCNCKRKAKSSMDATINATHVAYDTHTALQLYLSD